MLNQSKKLYRIYILFLLITFCQGFGLFNIIPLLKDLYSLDQVMIIILFGSLFFFLILIFTNKKIKLHFNNCIYFYLFLCFFCLQFIISQFRYNQTISQTLKEFLYYFIPLFAIFTYYQFANDEKNPKIISHYLLNISIICSMVAILSYILLLSNINILNISYSIRNGLPRYSIGINIVICSALDSCSKIFRKKAEKKDVFNLILAFVQIIIIDKTRSLFLYFFLTISIYLFIVCLRKKFKISVSILLTIGLFSILFFVNEKNIISIITNLFNNDAGVSIRLESIDFFWKEFLSSPIMGMGFISQNGSDFYLLIGQSMQYYRDDVGIIGLLNTFGIIGFLLTFSFLISKAFKNKSHSADFEKMFLLFLCISMINLSFLDPERLFYLVILFIYDTKKSPIKYKNINFMKGTNYARSLYYCCDSQTF